MKFLVLEKSLKISITILLLKGSDNLSRKKHIFAAVTIQKANSVYTEGMYGW